jgi:hypothetical protein
MAVCQALAYNVLSASISSPVWGDGVDAPCSPGTSKLIGSDAMHIVELGTAKTLSRASPEQCGDGWIPGRLSTQRSGIHSSAQLRFCVSILSLRQRRRPSRGRSAVLCWLRSELLKFDTRPRCRAWRARAGAWCCLHRSEWRLGVGFPIRE